MGDAKPALRSRNGSLHDLLTAPHLVGSGFDHDLEPVVAEHDAGPAAIPVLVLRSCRAKTSDRGDTGVGCGAEVEDALLHVRGVVILAAKVALVVDHV